MTDKAKTVPLPALQTTRDTLRRRPSLRRFRSALAARRRDAARIAVAGPVGFVITALWVGDPVAQLLSVLGTVTMLVFATFTGGRAHILRAELVLFPVTAVLFVAGSLAAQQMVIDAVGSAVASFVVLLSAALSRTVAQASTAGLVSFLMAATIASPADRIGAERHG
jgi:hypothetical protein